jgi:ATP-dependent exoDNAse (exonuclease V) alpha subunit
MTKKGAAMASYHLAVKTVSRSSGRSATAAAAYRAGVEIVDERTGLAHDYTRKQGVEHRELVLPDGAPEWTADRAALWNAAELAETRKNSTVAREFEVALPAELDSNQRRELVLSFAREISERHGVAIDVAIHAPHRDGDQRNHHAHLLATTRRLEPKGLGEKSRELDQKQSGAVERWRERWAELQNHSLELAGVAERVDHRSFKRQGIEAEPELKQGPAVTAMERRAESQASREGRSYEPVTAVGAHNAMMKERRTLRQFIERGNEWLKQHGVDVQAIAQSAAERIQALQERLSGRAVATNPNVSLAAERLRGKVSEMPERLREIEAQKERDREQDRKKDRGGPQR